MKTSHLDLTLRALDRLSPEEIRELESKLADDPHLAADLRATEDTIAAIWHAASPLVPAPSGSFREIQARLHPVRQRHFKGKAIAIGGWAAALALFAVLMERPQTARPSAVVSQEQPVAVGRESEMPAVPNTPRTGWANDTPQRKLRETVLALQQELQATRSGSTGPRIRMLRPPATNDSAAASDPLRALRDLLTAALTEDLARRTELPTTLTVENGWTPAAFASLPVGSVVRHRSFPVEDFADYGLLTAANGDFYDPVTHLVWSPAEDGGGYLGKLAEISQDLTVFKAPSPDPAPGTSRKLPSEILAESLPVVDGNPLPTPDPSGYLVEGADAEESTLIIGNLPTTDPNSQLIASVDGGATTFPLTDGVIVPGLDGTGFASFNLPSSMMVGNLSLSGNTSFSLDSRGLSIIQVNSSGGSTLILTTNPAGDGE